MTLSDYELQGYTEEAIETYTLMERYFNAPLADVRTFLGTIKANSVLENYLDWWDPSGKGFPDVFYVAALTLTNPADVPPVMDLWEHFSPKRVVALWVNLPDMVDRFALYVHLKDRSQDALEWYRLECYVLYLMKTAGVTRDYLNNMPAELVESLVERTMQNLLLKVTSV